MFETDWYLLDRSGRRYGPYDRSLVERLAAQHELRAETPVWHPGLARWQPAERVLKLPREAGSQATAPSSPTSPMPLPQRVEAKSPVKPRPAPRPATPVTRAQPRAVPAARSAASVPKSTITPAQVVQRVLGAAFDLLCLYIAFRLLRLVVPAVDGRLALRSGQLLLVAWALLDAAFVGSAGATPGRALFAVRTAGPQGERLDRARALAHAAVLPALLLVMTLQSGFLTVVAVVGLLIAAGRMRAGYAPWWDDVAGVRVTYGEITASRKSLAAAAFIAAILGALIVTGAAP